MRFDDIYKIYIVERLKSEASYFGQKGYAYWICKSECSVDLRFTLPVICGIHFLNRLSILAHLDFDMVIVHVGQLCLPGIYATSAFAKVRSLQSVA